MVEVIATDEFADWYGGLEDAASDATYRAVEVLRDRGVALRWPQSSDIKGSKVALRELRYQVGGHPCRVFYIFDPDRAAVLLLGGDKQGDDRFYEHMVPRAEKLWAEYLDERRNGLHR